MQIENNPDLINGWSIENLEKLEKIYDEIIEKYEQEILKLEENT